MIEEVLTSLSNVEGALGFFARIIGLKLLARALRRRRVMVKSIGFHFFTNRESMNAEFSTLGARLASVERADAIFSLGHKFYSESENLAKIARLILPNPTSASYKHFSTTRNQVTSGATLEDVIKTAKNAGTSVRLYPHFVGQSMVLADTAKKTGWVQIEIILPHSRTNARPSFSVESSRFHDLVADLQNVFNDMWDASKPAL